MKSITIIMQKTCVVSNLFDVPDSVYEEIVRTQRIPDEYFDIMEKECKEETEVEYDYRVEDYNSDRVIVDWE